MASGAPETKVSFAFWDEFKETRQRDPDSKDGWESKRAWAKRLGLDVNNIIQWERGGKPSAILIKRFCDKLRLPSSEYYRYLALAEDASPPFIAADEIPLFEGRVTAGENGRIATDKISEYITVGKDLLRSVNASRQLIALRLMPGADSMEPVIPRGSIVLVDTLRGKTLQGLEEGAVYAVITDPDTYEITIKYVVREGGELWIVPANEAYEPQRAWTDDPAQLIVGRVIHYQGVMSVTSGREALRRATRRRPFERIA